MPNYKPSEDEPQLLEELQGIAKKFSASIQNVSKEIELGPEYDWIWYIF